MTPNVKKTIKVQYDPKTKTNVWRDPKAYQEYVDRKGGTNPHNKIDPSLLVRRGNLTNSPASGKITPHTKARMLNVFNRTISSIFPLSGEKLTIQEILKSSQSAFLFGRKFKADKTGSLQTAPNNLPACEALVHNLTPVTARVLALEVKQNNRFKSIIDGMEPKATYHMLKELANPSVTPKIRDTYIHPKHPKEPKYKTPVNRFNVFFKTLGLTQTKEVLKFLQTPPFNLKEGVVYNGLKNVIAEMELNQKK